MSFKLTKRGLLFGTAGVLLIGGAAGYAVVQEPASARDPWTDALKPHEDVRIFALQHAILAPNPHNRQPWLVRLVDKDKVLLFCDLDKRLPQTDPFDRQITIGLGCFIELARIAAAERAIKMTAVYFPEGQPDIMGRLDKRPIALLTFDGVAAKDPLYAGILTRRSTKIAFDTTKVVSRDTLAKVLSVKGATTISSSSEDVLIKQMRDATYEAWLSEANTTRTYKESVDLMRIGKDEVMKNPDGVSLMGFPLGLMAAVGVLTREKAMEKEGFVFKTGNERYYNFTSTAMGYIWQSTKGNSRVQQLETGADCVRLNLQATLSGLAYHPISQALQEFPEMAGHMAKIRALLTIPADETLQMLMRVGYAKPVKPTPRWGLKEKIMG